MERRHATATREEPPRQQLPPGFRFHPTDEELLLQYLRRKAFARPLPAAVIPVVDAATLPDPWDLPGVSEGEAAYFFSLRQAPTRGGGGRPRRAASGYWKATGKGKSVYVQLQQGGSSKRLLVGVKTALAFHRGKGKARTYWVMHEYSLAALPGAAGAAVERKSANDSLGCEWVVCRVSLRNRARSQTASDQTTATNSLVHRAAGDHHQPAPSPSSSCVTDTCHDSDNQEEVSSASQ